MSLEFRNHFGFALRWILNSFEDGGWRWWDCQSWERDIGNMRVSDIGWVACIRIFRCNPIGMSWQMSEKWNLKNFLYHPPPFSQGINCDLWCTSGVLDVQIKSCPSVRTLKLQRWQILIDTALPLTCPLSNTRREQNLSLGWPFTVAVMRITER